MLRPSAARQQTISNYCFKFYIYMFLLLQSYSVYLSAYYSIYFLFVDIHLFYLFVIFKVKDSAIQILSCYSSLFCFVASHRVWTSGKKHPQKPTDVYSTGKCRQPFLIYPRQNWRYFLQFLTSYISHAIDSISVVVNNRTIFGVPQFSGVNLSTSNY